MHNYLINLQYAVLSAVQASCLLYSTQLYNCFFVSPSYGDKSGDGSWAWHLEFFCNVRAMQTSVHNSLCSSPLLKHSQDCTLLGISGLCDFVNVVCLLLLLCRPKCVSDHLAMAAVFLLPEDCSSGTCCHSKL